MKSKQSQSRLSTSLRSTEVSELDDSRLSLGHKGKFKKQLCINDPTIASLSQNQISTAFLNNKTTKQPENEEFSLEQNITQKKSRKSNKKKYIEKNIILRTRDRNGKSSRISKNIEEKRRKRLERKAQKLKQKLKRQKLKLKQTEPKSKPIIIKPKPIKPIKLEQKHQKMILDDCAQIRHIGFDRKQLQKKRDDLMKRLVDDWLQLQKSRSNTRQLRTLNI